MGNHQSASNRTPVSDVLTARPRRGRVDLTSIDPSQTNGVKRRDSDERTLADEEHVTALQECLHAEGKRSILIVLQGMDTSGKDGTIRHALRGLNPQGVKIVSFKQPSPNERRHDFLWRVRRQLPAPGEIVIFNRSHYEDVHRDDGGDEVDLSQPAPRRPRAEEAPAGGSLKWQLFKP